MHSFPAGIETQRRELRINKRTLLPAVYVIKLIVAMKQLGFSDGDEKFLEITREPLHVEIKGGATRLLSSENDIVLDGRGSYDPHVPTGSNNSLRYKWFCKDVPIWIHHRHEIRGCFGLGVSQVQNYKSKWTIPANKHFDDINYIIRLRIESLLGNAFAEVEQYLDVRRQRFIPTKIL